MEYLVDRIAYKKQEGVREGKTDMKCRSWRWRLIQNVVIKRILNSEATPLVTLRVSAIHRTDLKTFCYNLE